MASILDLPKFKSVELNPGATLQHFTKYIENLELLFELIFRKADGTPYAPSDREKQAMLRLKGGDDMRNLLEYVGKVASSDTFEQVVTKVKKGLSDRTNEVVQRNLLLANFPQGSKSFERWSQEVANAARLISYEQYDWHQATVDAILLQTSNSKLRERALQENTTYEDLMKMGVAKGAALLEKASGGTPLTKFKVEEEVRKLQLENQHLRSKVSKSNDKCMRCGAETCSSDSKCPANGRKCAKCGKENHYAKVCRSRTSIPKKPARSWNDPRKEKKKKSTFGQMSSAEDSESEESSGRIVVGHLSTKSIQAKVTVQGPLLPNDAKEIMLATDTGISKTLLNRTEWEKVKNGCKFVKTSKRFRPYGTTYHLPIKGKALVKLSAERGASIETWVYVVDDRKEQSLLGESDAVRLGIVRLDLKGSSEEVVSKVEYLRKTNINEGTDLTKNGTVEAEMEKIRNEFSDVFTDTTGKVKGTPIKIQVREDAIPVIQPPRRIPLHYIDRLEAELEKMKHEDIIEGPLEIEEPGTFLSNLVITDKKDSDRIRVTLDCQAVNKVIYPTHEPIPSSDELRHKLKGSERFSTLDMTNCYYQFEIEKEARKLFAFRTPWGIFRYKRMVMGTSPASSEVQKRIRDIISKCKNAIHIKDDIMVHGVGENHDVHLRNVLKMLRKNGITARPDKCDLGKSEVKWFGNIYSKHGMSTDPDKCKVIRDWPAPQSKSEAKSFLQTVQFNAKFLGGEAGEMSYPELTGPLRALTKNMPVSDGVIEKNLPSMKLRSASAAIESSFRMIPRKKRVCMSTPVQLEHRQLYVSNTNTMAHSIGDR